MKLVKLARLRGRNLSQVCLSHLWGWATQRQDLREGENFSNWNTQGSSSSLPNAKLFYSILRVLIKLVHNWKHIQFWRQIKEYLCHSSQVLWKKEKPMEVNSVEVVKCRIEDSMWIYSIWMDSIRISSKIQWESVQREWSATLSR